MGLIKGRAVILLMKKTCKPLFMPTKVWLKESMRVTLQDVGDDYCL
jgi:hypothetical protein